MENVATRTLRSLDTGVYLLGIGTTWFGRQWPPDEKSYSSPSYNEVAKYLDTIFRSCRTPHTKILIDTAPAYGTSEELIGKYFREYPNYLDHALIETKWGEEFDTATGKSTLIHTADHLAQSLKRSISRLGKIDVLLIHRTDPALLGRDDIKNACLEVKKSHASGVKAVGASFSNEGTLEQAVKGGHLGWLDIVQLPACVYIKRRDLATALKEHGIDIILNSPVRRGDGRPPRDIYRELIHDKDIAVVLTGTRHHLADTIHYCCNSK